MSEHYHTLPEQVLLAGEEERWKVMIQLLQEIKAEMHGVKVEIAGLVRDQRDAAREHSRMEVKIDHFEERISKLEEEIRALQRDRDAVKVTLTIGKFILGTGGVTALVAWFKGLGGH